MTPIGNAMASGERLEHARPQERRSRSALRCFALAAIVLLQARLLSAQDRYALVVAGAAGGPPYAEQYARWTEDLSTLLVDQMKFEPANVIVLREGGDASASPTAANVRRVFNGLRREIGRDDLIFVVLIGHGTFDGVDAKFNLVGPDLESAEWAALIQGLPGRIVLANTAPASFPFLERLAGPRRVVITATDTVAQRFDTVFPEFFIKALQDDARDIDKNGRISIWEAFAGATDSVRRYYQQRGQLATERALLDDNGDGVGHEASATSDDGSAAARTYLDVAAAGAPPTDEVLLQLLQKRAALQADAEELKIRKSFMSPAEYQQEFERIMIELAKLTRSIRQRTQGSN
jgi:hypothetical protein